MSVVVTEPVISGLVILKTTIGDISIELWSKEAPKAVRNFIQLCLEGYYDNCIFHRVIPGFIAQTGDASNTGKGGECIYDEGIFEDEYNQRLKFNRRGLVGMANQGTKNSNLSQFFFTLDATPELQGSNTLFGRVVNDTLFNVLSLNDIELEAGSDRPTYPPMIKSAIVIDNPFTDLVPRITAAERKEQEKAKRESKLERAQQREFSKRKGTKNEALLSFGAEPEEEMTQIKSKFKSSHEALDDPRLSKEMIDDRGTSSTLPDSLKRKAEVDRSETEKRGRMDPTGSTSNSIAPVASSSKLTLARAEVKAQPNANDLLQAKIAKVQADLQSMSAPIESTLTKKKKRSGPSLLQLEREKYLKKSDGKAKAKDGDTDVLKELEGFRSKVRSVVLDTTIYDSELPEDQGSGDEGWLEHSLRFRKDVTLDQHSIDEYSTHDPLAKNALSLDELKAKQDAGGGSRRYTGDREERNGRGNGSRNDRGNGLRNDRNDKSRDKRGGGESRNDSFGGGQAGRSQSNSWKNDRAKLS